MCVLYMHVQVCVVSCYVVVGYCSEVNTTIKLIKFYRTIGLSLALKSIIIMIIKLYLKQRLNGIEAVLLQPYTVLVMLPIVMDRI